MSTVSEIYDRRELVVNLTLRELRSRYKRSVLGWAWSLLNPISTVAIYWVVFSFLFKGDPTPGDPSGQKAYVLYLLCGLVPWNFLSGGINAGLGAIVGSSGLIKKSYFPREIVVLAVVGSLLVTVVIEMGVLLVLALILGNNILPWIPLVIVLIAITSLWVTGIALMMSVLNVYFRDMQHLIGAVLLQMLFYLTPIIYPFHLVEGRVTGPLLTLYKMNPIFQIIRAYRNAIWDLRFPSLATWTYLIVGGIIVLVMGLKIFQRYEADIVEQL